MADQQDKVILTIDDDPVYADLYRTILEPKGYRTVHAYDAAEGLAAASREKPVLVTLDIMMPEKKGFLDGYGLLRQIRVTEGLETVPVVMISALGGEDDAKQGIAAGANAFIPKQEMTPERLLKEINGLIGNES